LHDAVNAYGTLRPTPTASDAKSCTHRTHTGGPTLSDEAQLLPTPRATDGTKGCPAQRGSKGDLMLPSVVMHLLIAQVDRQVIGNRSTEPEMESGDA
jgi:DNA (cytosine-5)-methyltransferase 1